MPRLRIERNKKNEIISISISCALCRKNVVIGEGPLREAAKYGFFREYCKCGNFFTVTNDKRGVLVKQGETRKR